jgi:hypothetical protein
MTSSPSSARIPARLATPPMSISAVGIASRSFIIGSSECPPASSFASSPSEASRSRACSADSAAT